MERHQKRQLMVFQGHHEKFAWVEKNKLALSQSHEDDAEMWKVSSPILHALNTSNGQNSIRLKTNYYEIPTKRYEIGIQVTFDDIVLEKILKLLKTPVIYVQCKLTRETGFALTLAIPLKEKSVQNIDSEFATYQIYEYPNLNRSEIDYTIFLGGIIKYKHRNPCNVLEKLYNDKTMTDCCILTANKTEVRCHSNILAANSDVFYTMLISGMQESETKNIEMPGISDQAANELLAYLYGIEIDSTGIKDDLAFELLRAAHKYNITSLEELMMETLLFKPDEDFDMNTVLELYFFTLKVEHFHKLCGKTLDIMRKNAKGLVAASAYQDLLEQNPKEGAILALKLLELGSS